MNAWWRRSTENFKSSVILLIALTAFAAMTVLIKVAGQRIPLVAPGVLYPPGFMLLVGAVMSTGP